MIVNHNLQAMNANRQFNNVNKKRSKSVEKLSSGFKINRAADDAAGLTISEKMRIQIRGLSKASMNCQEGISMVQVADGAMNEVLDILHRGKELSVQAANDTLTDADRKAIQAEIEELKKEVDRIADTTTFNGMPLLQGSNEVVLHEETPIQIVGDLPSFIKDASSDLTAGHLTGTYSDGYRNYISGIIDFSSVNAENISELTGCGFNMTCATCNRHYSIMFTNDAESSSISSGDHYIYNISTKGVTNGSELINKIIEGTENGHPNNHFTQMKKSSDNANVMIIFDNRSSLTQDGNESGYRAQASLKPGVAYSAAATNTTTKGGLHIQAGALEGQSINIKLPEINSGVLGISSLNVTIATDSFSGASEAITAFDRAVIIVSEERSRMGAYQNRMEHTVKNLDNVVENTIAAESLIRDTDMSEEMITYSNAQILSQAGQAMVAQANQSAQGIMTLLG